MSLGHLYQRFYDTLAGKHPRQYPWHFQWLATYRVHSNVGDAFSRIVLGDRVLDVGCGTSPFRDRLPAGCTYTGMDIEGGTGRPDLVIVPDEPWPLADNSFDVILCTEVLEHVRDQDLLLGEMRRVLKPGGWLILSVPFLYNEHGLPWDYRRLSVYGLEDIFSPDYQIETARRRGKVGTVTVSLFLNWIDTSLCLTKAARYAKPFLLPAWLPFCLLMNVIGLCLDALDRTENFYQNVFMLARRNVSSAQKAGG
jgi:SAM-dependent methyltransferase